MRPSRWYTVQRSYDFYDLSRQLLQLCWQYEILYPNQTPVFQRLSYSPQQNEFHPLCLEFRTECLKDKQRNFSWHTSILIDLHVCYSDVQRLQSHRICQFQVLQKLLDLDNVSKMDNLTKSFLFHMWIRLNNTVALIQAVSPNSQICALSVSSPECLLAISLFIVASTNHGHSQHQGGRW